MSERIPQRYLTRRDLELVIRRAAEIEVAGGSDLPELSTDDVIRIARDVGLSEESARRALAEHAVSGASPAFLADRGRVSRLAGPALITAARRVSQSAEAAQARLELHFREDESLTLARRGKRSSLWEPATGVVAALARSVDLHGRGYDLAKNAKGIEVSVVPFGEDESLVTLVADLSGGRDGWFWGLGFGLGATASAIAIGVALAAGAPWVGLFALPMLPGTVALAKLGHRNDAQKMQRVLNGLLDRLEHDEPLAPTRTSWRDLLK